MKKLILLVFFLGISLCVWPQISMTVSGSNNCSGVTKTVTTGAGTLTAMGYTWTSFPMGPVFSSPFSASSSVVFNSAGIFTIAVAVLTGNGFEYADTVITVFSNPSIMLTQSSTTTCITINPGQFIPVKLSKPVDITPVGASTYSIFPSPPGFNPNPMLFTVRPSVSTCYTVVGAVANSCTGSAVACVTVIPQFSVLAQPPAARICLNDSIELFAGIITGPLPGPFTYNWMENSNAPPPSLNNYGTQLVTAYPQNTTTYTLEIMDGRSCVSYPSFATVTVDICTTVNENALSKIHWNVFPNPVKDKLKITSDRLPASFSIFVFNTLGRQVNGRTKINPAEQIDVSFLETGIYFIKVESEERAEVFKIVKE